MRKIVLWLLVLSLLVPLAIQKPNTAYSASQEELRKELAEIERQIAEQEKELTNIRGEKQTIQKKLDQLRREQTALQLKIKQTALRVRELSGQIDQTENSIKATNSQIENLKPKLAASLLEINELEQMSLLEILVVNESLHEAADRIGHLNDVSEGLKDIVQEMRGLKSSLEEKQEVLEDQHEQTKDLLAIQALQEGEYKVKVQEQNGILTLTKVQEAEYQALLSSARAKAGEIRARLYELAGGGQNVNFGEAVAMAKWASAQTGVRPAFLLAILTQESNLGKNVGTCNRAGDPPEKSWRAVMSPKRDQPHFPTITEELGLNTDTTPISCPMRDRKGKQIGWGGAMGPAQFIPSTWMAYRDRVSNITGRPANPWDIRDAFLAAAIKLGGSGAVGQGEAGEWRAAMLYFSGSTNTRFRFYGDNVLNIARRYQAEVEALN